MKIEVFKMERMQSSWEFIVDYNLSESGVHPLTVEELISQEEIDEIRKTRLGYIQTNGTIQLRETICQMYPGTDRDNILATNGSAEANFLLAWSNIDPGDEVVFMLPNYMQLWGLVRGFGADVKPYFLKEDLDWNPDVDELKSLVTEKTKIIFVTNPNNPSGGQLNEEARKTIIELADKVGAWIFSDEVYQGAELDGELTPTFWGIYPKVAVSCGLSKAYGLPGLRTGWIVAPKDFIQRSWTYNDYTTICMSAASDRLARIALRPENRIKILERTRQIIRTNFSILDDWFKSQDDLFHCIPPKAGAIALARYNLDINSTELTDKLREEKGVLLVPGDHFEMDRYIRFGFGEEKEYLLKALELVKQGLDEIKKTL